MVKVKILKTVITSQYGTLSYGDELATSEEFAKHLVVDCEAAEYAAVKVEQKITLNKDAVKHAKG